MLFTQGGLYYGPHFTPTRDLSLRFKPHIPNSLDVAGDGAPLTKGNLLILRRGKWKIKVVSVISDQEYDALGEGSWTAAWRPRRCSKPD
jgi:Tyrosyl-tRNA synthetase C-terminal domain